MNYFGHTGNDEYNMMNGWGGNSTGYSPWGWLLMFVIMVLVILGIILLIRYATNNQANKNSSDALDILKQRYAKGDITKKQFDEMKQDIK
ncbi:MAG: SHOCT domain-containing protein [Candidatus Saccharimonadales bacterium]